MDLDAVKFALLVGGPMFALHLVGIVEGLLLSHWLKTRNRKNERPPGTYERPSAPGYQPAQHE